MEFVQTNGKYVSDNKITGNASIQMEGKGTVAKVFTKSIEDGDWVLTRVFRPVTDKLVLGFETRFSVFPKWVRIITNGEVDRCSLTIGSSSSSSGGGENPDGVYTPEIDTFNELTNFVAGYDNSENLKDVIANSTAVATEQQVSEMFRN